MVKRLPTVEREMNGSLQLERESAVLNERDEEERKRENELS